MNWQPPTTTPDSTEPATDTPMLSTEQPVAEPVVDTAPVDTSVSEITSPDPLLDAPHAPISEGIAMHATEASPATQVDSVVETLMGDHPTDMIGEPPPTLETKESPSSGEAPMEAEAPVAPEVPEVMEAPVVMEAPAATEALPPGTVHIFESTSRRPIDKFIASCFNDIGRLVGAHINSGRRGTHITLTGITPTGVQRATPKGDTTEIPLPALEWAIKQLYWNGELTRSKMTESYKENGSTVASGVFQILGNCKWFEATESPLTLHFYRLQWEEENAD